MTFKRVSVIKHLLFWLKLWDKKWLFWKISKWCKISMFTYQGLKSRRAFPSVNRAWFIRRLLITNLCYLAEGPFWIHYEPCVRDASETKLIRLVYLFLNSSPEQPLNSLSQCYVFFRAIKPTVHRKQGKLWENLEKLEQALTKKLVLFNFKKNWFVALNNDLV